MTTCKILFCCFVLNVKGTVCVAIALILISLMVEDDHISTQTYFLSFRSQPSTTNICLPEDRGHTACACACACVFVFVFVCGCTCTYLFSCLSGKYILCNWNISECTFYLVMSSGNFSFLMYLSDPVRSLNLKKNRAFNLPKSSPSSWWECSLNLVLCYSK